MNERRKSNMTPNPFASKYTYGKNFNEFDYGQNLAGNDCEQSYYRSPFVPDRQFCRSYANHDEKCYFGMSGDSTLSKSQENRPVFLGNNVRNQFANKWTSGSSRNDCYLRSCSVQEKLSSKDVSVQVSIGDLQSYKKVNDINLYDSRIDLRNFDETEEVIHGTCKYCMKPLSDYDFECESASISHTFHPTDHYRHQSRAKNSVLKYTNTCYQDLSENPYEIPHCDVRNVNECFSNVHPNETAHFCPGCYYSFAPCNATYFNETCSNVYSRDVKGNSHPFQCSFSPYDGEEFPDNRCFLPHSSKAILYYNFQCSCDRTLEERDDRHNPEPIYELQRIPESSIPSPNQNKNFHKMCNAKYYVEYSEVSDYPTPPQKNTCKYALCNRRADSRQTSPDFNFDSWPVRRKSNSGERATQSGYDKETNSGKANNVYLLYISKDIYRQEENETKSCDKQSKTFSEIRNLSPDTRIGNAEKDTDYASHTLTSRLKMPLVETLTSPGGGRSGAIKQNQPPTFLSDFECLPDEVMKDAHQEKLMKKRTTSQLPNVVDSNRHSKSSEESLSSNKSNDNEDLAYAPIILECVTPSMLSGDQTVKGNLENDGQITVRNDTKYDKPKEIPSNFASSNAGSSLASSGLSPTLYLQNQPSTFSRIQNDKSNVSVSGLSEPKSDRNVNTLKLNESSLQRKTVKSRSIASVQRRFKNPEVMEDIYSNADKVLQEMKRVLIAKGRWNGK